MMDIKKNLISEFDKERYGLNDRKIDWNSNVYCLHYLNYHKISYSGRYGIVSWPFEPFLLPKGMEQEDAFKVLSYLSDYIEKNNNIKECSLESVEYLDKAINLDSIGFKRVEKRNVQKDKVIHLFTITGKIRLFKNSQYNGKYVEWYTPNVSKEDVIKIYEKIGMYFIDLKIEKQTMDEKLTFDSQDDLICQTENLYAFDYLLDKRNDEIINPMVDKGVSEIALYELNGNIYHNFSDMLQSNDDIKNYSIIEYLRVMAGKKDVIKKTSSNGEVQFYTMVDFDGYATYNHTLSVLKKEFVWEYNYGSLKEIYQAFKFYGIELSNDIYGIEDKFNEIIMESFLDKSLVKMMNK